MSDGSLGAQSPEDEHEDEHEQAHQAEPAKGAAERAPVDEHETNQQVPETDQQKQARLDAALKKYRATLRNEAETGDGGFSADYYRSQKPPHW